MKKDTKVYLGIAGTALAMIGAVLFFIPTKEELQIDIKQKPSSGLADEVEHSPTFDLTLGEGKTGKVLKREKKDESKPLHDALDTLEKASIFENKDKTLADLQRSDPSNNAVQEIDFKPYSKKEVEKIKKQFTNNLNTNDLEGEIAEMNHLLLTLETDNEKDEEELQNLRNRVNNMQMLTTDYGKQDVEWDETSESIDKSVLRLVGREFPEKEWVLPFLTRMNHEGLIHMIVNVDSPAPVIQNYEEDVVIDTDIQPYERVDRYVIEGEFGEDVEVYEQNLRIQENPMRAILVKFENGYGLWGFDYIKQEPEGAEKQLKESELSLPYLEYPTARYFMEQSKTRLPKKAMW